MVEHGHTNGGTIDNARIIAPMCFLAPSLVFVDATAGILYFSCFVGSVHLWINTDGDNSTLFGITEKHIPMLS